MRRSGVCQFCTTSNNGPCETGTIAPHIHVLYRDIPFILNITHPSFSHKRVSSFRNHCLVIYAQSRGYAVPYFRTVRGRKPSIERHMDVLERVLKEGTAYPRLPRKLRVCWLIGYLESNSTVSDMGLGVPESAEETSFTCPQVR